MTSPPPPASYSYRALMSLAWPVVLARSTQAVIGFCDALMTAPLGKPELAATTTGAMNVFAVAILPMGTAFIVQSFAAQLKGRGNMPAARRYAWYGLVLAAVTGLFGVAAMPLVDPVLGLLAYDADVHALMSGYISTRIIALGAIVGIEALGNWYGGLGNTWLQMVAGIIAMVINVFLNWVLIYGNLGAPAMGVEGAALASTIASWIAFGFLLLVFMRGKFAPPVGRRVRLRRSEFFRMLRFGTPNGFNWFLEFAAFMLFINVVVADLGTVVLAAMMVVISINSVSFMPAFGLTSAGAILAGQAIGSDRKDLVPGIVKRTAIVTACWQGAVGVFYVAIPGVLMGWFAPGDDTTGEMIAIGTVLLAISAAWQLFDSVAMTLSEALRSAGDTTWTLWARLAIAWVVFTPASIVSVMVLGGGYIAAMICLAGYLAVLAVVFYWRFRRGAWREIDLTGLEPEVVA